MKPVTEDDLHAIRKLREILELGAVRLAHKMITKEQIAALEKICVDFMAITNKVTIAELVRT